MIETCSEFRFESVWKSFCAGIFECGSIPKKVAKPLQVSSMTTCVWVSIQRLCVMSAMLLAFLSWVPQRNVANFTGFCLLN
jgi:hypothetical protein